MTLFKSKIIAPDSSHWAKWIDAALSSDFQRRTEARQFHHQLLEAGRIPLLSWHHLEELLSIENDECARDRIEFIQNLPFVAFLRLPSDEVGLGGITDILAAEAIAAVEGANDALSVRNRAKHMLLKVGSGTDAIGDAGWVWQVVRSDFTARNAESKKVVAIASFHPFDDQRTIGEISKGTIRAEAEFETKAKELHSALLSSVRLKGDRRILDAKAIADDFIDEVLALRPPLGMSVRELLVTALTAQGVDEWEVKDECKLSELNGLARFRTKLRIVASKTGMPFEKLKSIEKERLPCWLIEDALNAHGQKRRELKGRFE
jgi:hypothetical protein